MIREILFLLVVLLTNIVQCITGFAGTVLAMPFSVMLVGYVTAKPILNILGFLASFSIAVPAYKKINYKILAKMYGGMLTGMLIGFIINNHLSITQNQSLIYKILGVTVIVFAFINVIKHQAKHDDKSLPAVVNLLVLIVSGVVHGVFLCGGPLLVTYASQKMPDKEEFHATVSASWILLNGLIFMSDYRAGFFTRPTLELLALSVIALLCSIIIGRIIYKKLSREVFLWITYILMLISGLSLLVK